MPSLRELLSRDGFEEVTTYVQSGNVVLRTDLGPDQVALRASNLIADRFGFEVPVVVRTASELAEVVRLNPLADVATDPKRYQVSFCSEELAPAVVEQLSELAADSERVVAIGREIYAWHPAGVARSKLWNRLAGTGLGVTATARNWTTVTTLLSMAHPPEG